VTDNSLVNIASMPALPASGIIYPGKGVRNGVMAESSMSSARKKPKARKGVVGRAATTWQTTVACLPTAAT
jgi:hypothetical protein